MSSSDGNSNGNTDDITNEDLAKLELVKNALSQHDYQYIKPIGKGGFSSVYLVYSRKYNQQFVCKISDINHYEGSEAEIKVLMQLSHPNIILMYDYFYYIDPHSTLKFKPHRPPAKHHLNNEEQEIMAELMNDHSNEHDQAFKGELALLAHHKKQQERKGLHLLFMILEYCPYGSLSDYLKEHQVMSPPLLFSICAQAIDALKFCHENNVAHRDIKPANFLLDKNNRLKLADFGLSDFLDHEDESDLVIGSRLYMSPQLFTTKKSDPFKNDVWSLGVTFYQLSMGFIPWRNQSLQQMKMTITMGNFNFNHFKGSPQFIRSLREMLQPEPDRRWTIDQLSKQEIFNDAQLTKKMPNPEPFPTNNRRKSILLNSGVRYFVSDTKKNDQETSNFIKSEDEFVSDEECLKHSGHNNVKIDNSRLLKTSMSHFDLYTPANISNQNDPIPNGKLKSSLSHGVGPNLTSLLHSGTNMNQNQETRNTLDFPSISIQQQPPQYMAHIYARRKPLPLVIHQCRKYQTRRSAVTNLKTFHFSEF